MRRNLVLMLFASLFVAACTPADSAGQTKGDDLTAVFTTTKGVIRVELFPEEAPVTVASFANLCSRNFYDGLKFHRVIPNFMIQGGDPEGTGRGGPGYRFEDEISPERRHSGPGVLSMANSGPGTNGSQFFITHNAAAHLDGKHTVFGKVIEGQDVVNAIVKDDVMSTVRVEGDTGPLFKAQDERIRLFNLAIDDPVAYRVEMEKGDRARYAEQDARQREAALAFAKSRGLDLSKGVESDAGVWGLVINEGEGPLVTPQNKVTAHCTGWLADGTKFWSTHDGEGKPMSNMPATGFVEGFTEALQTMKAGGKSLFIFPSRLAYGPNGNPRAKIPPNATLVFEIELISID